MGRGSGKLYPVRAVLKPVYVSKHDRFFFRTEWEEVDKDGKPVVTDIALENFVTSPSAIFNFGKTWRTRAVPPEKNVKKSLSRRLCKKEYIPTGKEYVRKIYNSFSVKLRGNAEEFYCVSFWGHETPQDVRLLFMEYYFPRELLMYWIENNRKGPRFGK
jgi:hypothetical protein